MDRLRQWGGWNAAHQRRVLVLGSCIAIGCLTPGPKGVALGAVCGNGIAESGEQCDDGAANGGDGCCSATCQLIDADHDGVCDALDPCTNIVPVMIGVPRLVLSNSNAGGAVFTIRGSMVVPSVPPIDPPSKGVRLVLRHNFYDIPLDAVVPGGSGWRASPGGNAWVYRDPTGASGGIRQIKLRQVGATPGALAFEIDGTHSSLAELTQVVPLKVSVVIDSPTATTGQCGETWLRPSLCRLDRAGVTLRCGSLPHLFPCRGLRPQALVRCDLGKAVAAEEAYWATNHTYFTGPCRALPGFLPSPGVVCLGTGTYRDFTITSSHPSARDGCIWNTCLVPGRPPVFCGPFPLTANCGG